MGSVYLLPPSSQPASVSVNVTIGGTTTTYTYSTSDQLEAGYKINIEGTYTEAVGVSLTGTITGATWLGERTITFTFDESGATAGNTDPTPDPTPTGAGSEWLPAAGTAYQSCTVLAATATGDDTADLLLLAPASTEDAYRRLHASELGGTTSRRASIVGEVLGSDEAAEPADTGVSGAVTRAARNAAAATRRPSGREIPIKTAISLARNFLFLVPDGASASSIRSVRQRLDAFLEGRGVSDADRARIGNAFSITGERRPREPRLPTSRRSSTRRPRAATPRYSSRTSGATPSSRTRT